MYPSKMEANGNIYDINTDYRVAIACLKAINDDSISELERFYAVEYLLLGDNVLPQDEPIISKKIANYLRCGNEENIKDSEIDMDYIQDEVEIKTGIRQTYNLDLNKVNLHWYEYNELISGLPTECLLNRIRDLRSYDVSKITDINERTKVIEAKKRVEIKKKSPKLTDEQMKSIDRFYELQGINRKR